MTDAVRLVRPLAEGGMGRVWIAEHLGLHTEVVVKLMAQEMAAREDGATRFAREAAVAAAIKSPHVVQVFDHGVTKQHGVPYIVMELLEGKDLGAVLEERGRLEPAEAAQVVVQIGKALAKAHRAGIVHRDIKPENIFLCSADSVEADEAETDEALVHVKLLDFGTAKEARSGAPDSKVTVPGEIMGTPYYMSPEQAIGATVDARTDMWSLGIVAFEILTGKKPFEGANVGAIALAIHAGLPPISSRVDDLPAALDGWFARACAQIPHERFGTMREMTAAFVEALTGVSPGDTTEAIVLPRRISVRPSSPPRDSSPDDMRKTLPTTIEPSIPPPSSPHPAFSETASFGSSLGAVEVPGRERAPSGPKGAAAESIAPLAATLPDRRSTQRPTRIAAGLVGAAALAVMGAIVMHRPAAAPEPADVAAATPPPVKTAEPEPEPVDPADMVKADAPTPEPAAVAEPRAHAKAKRGAKPAAAKPASSAAPAAPASGKKGSAKEDEDLARLIKAGTDPAPAPTPVPPKSEPAPAPTPVPPKSEPAPAPTPLPPAPAPTPVPPKSDPAPAPTPVPPKSELGPEPGATP